MTTAEWIAQQKRKAGVPTGLTGNAAATASVPTGLNSNAAATVSSLNASRAQQQALVDEAAARARSQAIAQADAAVRATATPASNTTPPQPASSMNLSGINYGNVNKRSIDAGFRTANDADRQMWDRITEAYNSGDMAQVNFLLNMMQGQGNFSGFYDDDGLWYGYVRGNNGAANGSYLPVIGGKLISTGELDTNQWLAPNGQVWSGSLGGALSNTGGTWSYGSTTPASTTARTGAGGTAASPLPTVTKLPASTTPTAYEKAISTVSDTTPANPYGESQPDSMWQRYLAAYDSQTAPEYGGSEYTALRDAAMRQASEPFAYDYNLDPVWQAYRKEYTREGRLYRQQRW